MKLTVNGKSHEIDVEPEMPLLWVLRDELKAVPPPRSRAWIEHQVAQRGYCQSGQIMSAAALLQMNQPPPTSTKPCPATCAAAAPNIAESQLNLTVSQA